MAKAVEAPLNGISTKVLNLLAVVNKREHLVSYVGSRALQSAVQVIERQLDGTVIHPSSGGLVPDEDDVFGYGQATREFNAYHTDNAQAAAKARIVAQAKETLKIDVEKALENYALPTKMVEGTNPFIRARTPNSLICLNLLTQIIGMETSESDEEFDLFRARLMQTIASLNPGVTLAYYNMDDAIIAFNKNVDETIVAVKDALGKDAPATSSGSIMKLRYNVIEPHSAEYEEHVQATVKKLVENSTKTPTSAQKSSTGGLRIGIKA